ncbi:hypothetical protein DOTSEDRAFT_72456 [Dothistroma septosporum NZE10]|uniref:Uncharacterized protein n=1 Tax=Dothistroma septosporum (strain NZE10 / CBS 128990) TaxID=675120 RepID=M2XKP2_DOTSN|nr:hypothetical protein DOTSEDRAFT_72456 [Dothistroma septosporum NZE10]
MNCVYALKDSHISPESVCGTRKTIDADAEAATANMQKMPMPHVPLMPIVVHFASEAAASFKYTTRGTRGSRGKRKASTHEDGVLPASAAASTKTNQQLSTETQQKARAHSHGPPDLHNLPGPNNARNQRKRDRKKRKLNTMRDQVAQTQKPQVHDEDATGEDT